MQNILNDIYVSKNLIFNNILRQKDNPQKVKALRIFKTIRFPDRKTQIIKKIILQIQWNLLCISDKVIIWTTIREKCIFRTAKG